MQYFSLQHWTLLSPSDTSTTEYHFHFGPATSFFLGLIIIALVAYQTPSNLGNSSSGVSFWLFHIVHGVLKARILKWFAIPFSSGSRFVRGLHHDLSVLGGPHSMARSFIDLCKSLCYDKAVIHEKVLMNMFFLNFFIFLRSTAVG